MNIKVSGITLAACLLGYTANAKVNFAEPYQPTLSKLYDSDSPIKSGYGLNFKDDYSGPIDFIYYHKEEDGTFTMVDYIIATTVGGGDSQFLSREDVIDSKPDGFIGYFHKQNSIEGGALKIDNTKVGAIYADFIKNNAQFGGAINNKGDIKAITGDFIQNSATNDSDNSLGGAVFNTNNIEKITGNFIGNKATSNEISQGGAIYNKDSSVISEIKGDFIGNFTESATEIEVDITGGGAILNSGKITQITGDFVGNYASGKSLSQTYGGAIINSGLITQIDGDFNGNYTFNNGNGFSRGGAIYNFIGGEIKTINGDFISNSAIGGSSSEGGAIYMEELSLAGNINGNFINNVAGNGGAIYVGNMANIVALKSNFSNNNALNNGGAIYLNSGSIGKMQPTSEIEKFSGGGIIGDFKNNNATGNSGRGGAIYANRSNISNIKGNFDENYVRSYGTEAGDGAFGGAIAAIRTSVEEYEMNKLKNQITHLGGGINGNFTGNFVESQHQAYGGAIAGYFVNPEDLTSAKSDPARTFISGNFINNYASTESTTARALGGAIYNIGSLSLIADGADYLYSGNYTYDAIAGKVYNAIFIETGYAKDLTNDLTAPKLSIDLANNGSITFNDNIIGGRDHGASALDGGKPTDFDISYDESYDINIKGEKDANGNPTGMVVFNNEVINAKEVNVENAVLRLGSFEHSDQNAQNYKGNGLFKSADGSGSITNLTLTNSVLDLAYDDYQELELSSITSNGDQNQLSFGANFEQSKSDSITVSSAYGDIKLKSIYLDGKVQVGDTITLFNNGMDGYLGISNIDNFKLVYEGEGFKLSYTNGMLKVEESLGDAYPIYNSAQDTSHIESSVYDGSSDHGVLINKGEVTINNSTFANNMNLGNNHSPDGNGGVILNINSENSSLDIIDSSFTSNTASGKGGAIYSEDDVKITANKKDVILSGNTDASGNNDIYMEQGKELHLAANTGKKIDIDSGINGDDGGYNIAVSGSGDININSNTNNVDTVTINSGNLNVANSEYLTDVNLVLNGGVYGVEKNQIGDINIKNLTGNGGSIWLDIDPDQELSDIINVSGDMTGTTGLVLNVLSENQPEDRILFATTPNYDPTSNAGFEVYRTMGSPFKWTTEYDEDDKNWYFPIPSLASNILVEAEVLSYIGLQSASIEQTRSMVSNVRNKVSANKIPYKRCGVYDECYNAEPLHNVWINPIYHTSTIKKPVHIESDIWGLEAGFDLQQDANNKIGFFASYRRGDYDLNGKGSKFISSTKSNIDIDSYLAGLYYRYDQNNSRVFATIYGGIQTADIKTNDGVKSDNDGMQFGGSIEAGHVFYAIHGITLDPTIGLYYTQIDWDKAKDNFAKRAKYDTVRQLEIEAGIAISRIIAMDKGYAKYYIKPSIVQTITDGDNVNITGLNNVRTYNDQLLGRIEVGGKVSITESLSGFGYLNYTGGSNYSASSFGLGLNYAW